MCDTIKESFEQLQGTELQRSDFHENMTWDDYVTELSLVASDDKKLKHLIRAKEREDNIDQVTLDKIMSSNFLVAKDIIDQMTIAKRITMLEEVHTYRDYLYNSLGRYGGEGLSKDEQLSPADFRMILGRVKHLEILLNWLYGIV